MPTLVTHRGKARYRGTVWVDNTRGPTKLFPDDSKKSYRYAIEWENSEREKLRKRLNSTRTESSTIRAWVNEYMTHVKSQFSDDTYKEKKSVFARFNAAGIADPDDDVSAIDRFMAAKYFTGLMATPRQRGAKAGDMHLPTGNAVNRDRKNLLAAWSWGKENMKTWPDGIENPFSATVKKPEKRHPRYVPTEEDFWAVYDYVAGLAEDGGAAHVQDRIILLAYLHTAARRTELFRATWDDVDFGRKKIRLWTRKREGGTLEYDWIPLTEALSDELAAWKRRRMAMDTEDKQHVFVCLSNALVNGEYFGRPFTSRQHVMKKWCNKVSVVPFGWHAIRHFTASTLYADGAGQADIQAILRHKSPSTTARYMRSIGLDEVRDVLERGLKRGKFEAQIIPFEQRKTA